MEFETARLHRHSRCRVIGWPPYVGAALAVALNSTVNIGTIGVAISVLLVGGWAVFRSKGLEAWKETANAASLGRGEAVARNEQLEKQLLRERELNDSLEERLALEKGKTDLTPLTEKMLAILANDRAYQDRAEARHEEMMALLGEVVQNTAHP